MATDAREARRKRILERGSDRLALITGRVESIPTPQPQPHHLHTVSLPVSMYEDQDSQSALSRQDNNDASQDANAVPRHEISNERPPTRKLKPQLQRSGTHIDKTRIPDSDIIGKIEPPIEDPPIQMPPIQMPPIQMPPIQMPPIQMPPIQMPPPSTSSLSKEAQPHPTKLFTAKKISASISATENIRILTSFSIALLVVLSHLRIPLLSSNIVLAIVSTRPVFLVLLTDLTVLLALILVEKKQPLTSDKKDEEMFKFAEGLGMLQNGLTVYKAFTAVLMDCSIYFVVVITGLSLVQMF